MLNILSTSPRDEVEKLLRRSGYQILGKNQKEIIIAYIDGKDHLGDLAAEYTVRKAGKSYVVVTKSGEGEFDPTEPALRRRLIEYDRTFGLNGVLIVDPQEGKIHEVRFKFPRERGIDFYFQFIIALFILLVVIGIIWLMVNLKLF